MTGRAPAEPEYSKQSKPRAGTEANGAAHRITAIDRPYQGVTRPEHSGYLWASWLRALRW